MLLFGLLFKIMYILDIRRIISLGAMSLQTPEDSSSTILITSNIDIRCMKLVVTLFHIILAFSRIVFYYDEPNS